MSNRFVQMPGGRLVRRGGRFGGETNSFRFRDYDDDRLSGSRMTQRELADQEAELLLPPQPQECPYAGQMPPADGGCLSIVEGGSRLTLLYSPNGEILGAAAR